MLVSVYASVNKKLNILVKHFAEYFLKKHGFCESCSASPTTQQTVTIRSNFFDLYVLNELYGDKFKSLFTFVNVKVRPERLSLLVFPNDNYALYFCDFFLNRELDMGAQTIIEMEGKKTRIYNLKVA